MDSSTNARSLSESSSLAELSDAELLIATRRLVGRSNQLLAAAPIRGRLLELMAEFGSSRAGGA